MASSSLAKFKFAFPQPKFACHECKENIFKTGDICKDRAEHYVRRTVEVHSCPVCWLILPTKCAMTAHLRLHLKVAPYICPQCGITLPETILSYPFNHKCEGFNTMRTNIKFKCNLTNCNEIVHPTQFKEHFQTHLDKVYQCTLCSLIWSNDTKTRCSHHNDDNIIQSIGFQCILCTNNLIADNMENHVNKHYDELCHHWNTEIYQCKICQIIHRDVKSLLNHHVLQHNAINIGNIMKSLSLMKQFRFQHNTNHFRVTKTCNMCLMSYICQTTNENMNTQQNTCPNGCLEYNGPLMKCPLCEIKINPSWVNVKMHFAKYHKVYKCLDLQVNVTRMDMSSYCTMLKNKTQVTQNYSEEALAKVNESTQTAGNQFKKIKIAKNETVVRNDDNDLDSVERKVVINEVYESVQKIGMDIDPLKKDVKSVQIAESLAHCNNTKNETQESNEDDNLMEEQVSVPVVNESYELEQAAECRSVTKNTESEKSTKEDNLAKAGCSGINKNNEPKQAAKKQYICKFCKYVCDIKENFKTHLVIHRVRTMPYQCLECGTCNASITSFTIHMIKDHNIREVQEYINTNPCYNEAALYESPTNSVIPSTAVKENQCDVCYEQLQSANELDRHARMHGLAFVLSLKRKRQDNPDVM